jgi:hypothetical protein
MEPLRDSSGADPPQEMDQLSPTGEKLFEKDADDLLPDRDEDKEDVDDDDDDDYGRGGEFTPEEERVVLRKLDKRIVGLVALLYLLSFLDRSSRSIPPASVCTVADLGMQTSAMRGSQA